MKSNYGKSVLISTCRIDYFVHLFQSVSSNILLCTRHGTWLPIAHNLDKLQPVLTPPHFSFQHPLTQFIFLFHPLISVHPVHFPQNILYPLQVESTDNLINASQPKIQSTCITLAEIPVNQSYIQPKLLESKDLVKPWTVSKIGLGLQIRPRTHTLSHTHSQISTNVLFPLSPATVFLYHRLFSSLTNRQRLSFSLLSLSGLVKKSVKI